MLTRPAAQALAWQRQLQALGVPTLLRPLIETHPVPEHQAQARALALQADWVFFTSSAAVQALFGTGWAWPAQARALCVGPGTAAALQAAGVPAARILCPPTDAPQFDSETLWPLLRGRVQPGAQLLWLRGDGGRDWLIEQLRAAGAEVQPLTVYRRSAPQMDAAEQQQLAEWLRRPLCWLFSSSEAVDHLQRLAVVDWPRLQAWATHSRIAARLGELGCTGAQVLLPQPEAVAHAWRSRPAP